MKFLRKYADNTRNDSIVNKWRRKRFSVFTQLVKGLPKPVKILDVGGTENFWVQMGFTGNNDALITLLNTKQINTSYINFTYTYGDARDLKAYVDNEFDVVFSNSVIEHVGDFNDQQKMANEIRRVGKKYYLQTPNYYFPIEPHFLFPFFQFLPMEVKVFLTMKFKLGWFEKCITKNEAMELVNSIRLLKRNEIEMLFPDGRILKEKVFGLTKSFMVVNKSKTT